MNVNHSKLKPFAYPHIHRVLNSKGSLNEDVTSHPLMWNNFAKIKEYNVQ